MKKYFSCEQCGEVFTNENLCLQHEKNCFEKKAPVKVIMISRYLDDVNDKNAFEVHVIEYANALFRANKVNLVPDSYHVEPIEIKFESILKRSDSIFVFTTNFDKQHEEELIQKLLQYKKDYLQNDLDEYIRDIKNTFKKIDDKFYIIKREENFRQVYEVFSEDADEDY